MKSFFEQYNQIKNAKSVNRRSFQEMNGTAPVGNNVAGGNNAAQNKQNVTQNNQNVTQSNKVDLQALGKAVEGLKSQMTAFKTSVSEDDRFAQNQQLLQTLAGLEQAAGTFKQTYDQAIETYRAAHNAPQQGAAPQQQGVQNQAGANNMNPSGVNQAGANNMNHGGAR